MVKYYKLKEENKIKRDYGQSKSMIKSKRLKSVQNGVADFNYFLLLKVNRFLNKVINIMMC